MNRPSVDIVVPFVGSDATLRSLATRLAALQREPGDTITIADNRPTAPPGERVLEGGVTVRGAAGLPSSYFARNRGVEQGGNEWIVFLDADVDPIPDLLPRYFATAPGDEDGILIGGIYDAPPGPTAVEQFSYRKGAVGHETTTRDDGFTFAQTANAAVRRAAFEAIGGFTEDIRSGGDADLCFRIQQAGYAMVPRHDAKVTHENRTTLKSFVRQYARYGSGAAWLEARYPGFSPRPNPVRVVGGLGMSALRALRGLVRGDRLEAQVNVMDGVQKAASAIGRRFSNRVPGS